MSSTKSNWKVKTFSYLRKLENRWNSIYFRLSVLHPLEFKKWMQILFGQYLSYKIKESKALAYTQKNCDNFPQKS